MIPWSDFEELAFCPTPIGDLQLRRRRDPAIAGVDIFEIRLDEAFLMSSLFHASEVALADRALARLRGQRDAPWNVVVGGLGLGHTAAAALDDERVGELLVIELLAPIMAWHREGLVPLGERVARDARCRLIERDFFAAAGSQEGFDPQQPARRFDAVLLDIDHTPVDWLDASSQSFYAESGLAALARHLHPGGVFGLWSDAPADDAFVRKMGRVFEACEAHRIAFANPYTGGESAGTVYLGSARPG